MSSRRSVWHNSADPSLRSVIADAAMTTGDSRPDAYDFADVLLRVLRDRLEALPRHAVVVQSDAGIRPRELDQPPLTMYEAIRLDLLKEVLDA